MVCFFFSSSALFCRITTSFFGPLFSFAKSSLSLPRESHDSDRGAFATKRDVICECSFASLTRAEPPESGDDCTIVVAVTVVVVIEKAASLGVSPRCWAAGLILDLFFSSPSRAPSSVERDPRPPPPPPRLRLLLLLHVLGPKSGAAENCRRRCRPLALGRLGGRGQSLHSARGGARGRGRGVGARCAARVAAVLRGSGE